MGHSLLAVEGAHDASFFGLLPQRRGFAPARRLDQVPPFWLPLIPRRFSNDDHGRLNRVIRFPEVCFLSRDNTVGIVLADGEDNMMREVRVPLERLGPQSFVGVGLALDADAATTVSARFGTVTDRLRSLNAAAAAEGVPGFPLGVPPAPGVVASGYPKVGIHLFPDNRSAGTLEDVLLSCAQLNHTRVHRAASALIEYLDKRGPHADPALSKLRRGSGRAKAKSGVIGNVLNPGTSLAVAVCTAGWLDGPATTTRAVLAADGFIGDLL